MSAHLCTTERDVTGDATTRLQMCFAAVFPSVPNQQLSSLQAAVCDEWDSLATVTLVATVEEEFGTKIASEDAAELVSFQGFVEYLRKHGSWRE